jgi:diketogulonate reductase-like aldo/keto reductase
VPEAGIILVLVLCFYIFRLYKLGLLPLPKTANPEHMKNNSDVDFVISNEDIAILKNMEQIKDYGDASIFPVFGRKLK